MVTSTHTTVAVGQVLRVATWRKINCGVVIGHVMGMVRGIRGLVTEAPKL